MVGEARYLRGQEKCGGCEHVSIMGCGTRVVDGKKVHFNQYSCKNKLCAKDFKGQIDILADLLRTFKSGSVNGGCSFSEKLCGDIVEEIANVIGGDND